MPDNLDQDLDQFGMVLLKYVGDNIDMINDRETIVPVSMLETHSLLQLLEDNMLKWPLRDHRISLQMKDQLGDFSNTPYRVTSSEPMWNMYRGMDLKVHRRLPIHGTIEFGIHATINTADFEDYNALIQDYNNNLDNGTEKAAFDPVTGEMTDNRMVFVRDLFLDSRHCPNRTNYKPGRLDAIPGIPKPVQDVHMVAKVICHIETENDKFIVKTVVETMEEKRLWWNTVTGDNLSEVTRMTMHGIFGNPEAGDVGDFLQGIILLYRGEKVKHSKGKPYTYPQQKLNPVKEVDQKAVNREKTWEQTISLAGQWIPNICYPLAALFMFRSLTADLIESNALYTSFGFITIAVASRLITNSIVRARADASKIRNIF